jgi:hypothetical protein
MPKCKVEVLESFPVNSRYQRIGSVISMDRKQAKSYAGRGRVKILKGKGSGVSGQGSGDKEAKAKAKKTENRAILETE